MGDWQPIETAPRQEWVLLSWGGAIPSVGAIRPDGTCGLWTGEIPFKTEPKYWMPLPEPPEPA